MDDRDIQWEALLRTLREYAEAVIYQAEQNLASDGSNASRTLTNSFSYDYGIDDNHYWVEIFMEDYWKYVNDGRRPGKRPPRDKIAEWIRVKPIQPKPYTYTPSVKSLAFLIQRSIKQKKGYAPPRTVLEGWIQKKGIQPRPQTVTPSVESLAFLIARKIGERGTKGTNFLDRAVDTVNKAFRDKIADAIQSDIKYWLEEVIADDLNEAII